MTAGIPLSPDPRRTADRRRTGAPRGAQDLVAGLTPGLSLKNCLFSSM
jgi:hypothetical protein